MSVQLLTGDVRAVLRTLPSDHFHTVVTSPPYFGLRSYLPENHPNKHLELGLEKTLEEYIAEMVLIFSQIRRVLRPDGTLWLNIGDSYAGRWDSQPGRVTPQMESWRNRIKNCPKGARRAATARAAGVKHKDLFGVPWRLAFALQAAGWWLRSEIVWAKPNPMPESAPDRPTSAHEKIFLLTKSDRYFWDAEAVRENRQGNEDAKTFRGDCYVHDNIDNATAGKRGVKGNKLVKVPGGWDRTKGTGSHGTIHREGRTEAKYEEAEISSGRNIRNVWTMAPEPFPEAHFATFPTELAARCIRAGSSAAGCCASCGAPVRQIVTKGEPDLEHQRACGGDAKGEYAGKAKKDFAAAGAQDASAVKARILKNMRKRKSDGARFTCDCSPAAAVPCRVLDPFGGSGTTAVAADRLRRDVTLIDLHEGYAEMQRKRIASDAGLFADVTSIEAA